MQPRCFVCMSTADTKTRPMFYCCRCRSAHEKCFIDYMSAPHTNMAITTYRTKLSESRQWFCSTCQEPFKAQLSGTSFWFSLCATNIQTWKRLNTINTIFTIECVLTFLIQLLLCAYVAKFILWIFTHATTFTIGDTAYFTLRPNFSDILLGLIAYFVLVPPCMLLIYLVRLTIRQPKKSERPDEDNESDDIPMTNLHASTKQFTDR